MKLNFTGNTQDLMHGIELLSAKLGIQIEEGGKQVRVEKTEKEGLSVSIDNENIKLTYTKKTDFFRALAILVYKLKCGVKHFKTEEMRSFNSDGAMLDVSRNAVLKVEAVKKFIRHIATMGLDTLYMYMEDTYKIEGYEYFGYMRGAYSKKELKEIVSYADIFGVEVIPCIQTLAHLGKTLKWRYAIPMRDTADILFIDEPETYKFIEAMIKTVKECFKTDKIHIGMDEAQSVGMGAYFSKHGLVEKFSLMSRHLEKVEGLTRKYGLKPMIWSDMFYRLGSKTGDYYDTNAKIPENISELIPENMSIVYWDYYNEDENLCDFFIKSHLDMKRHVVFAGGVWIWGSYTPDYRKTFSQSRAALKMCRKNKIKDVFATLWGDDGAETSVFESLLGLQLFSEFNFYDEVSDEHLAEMFKICTGYDMDAFLLLGLDGLNESDIKKRIDDSTNVIQTSKQLLFQDVLLGLFDENYKNEPMREFYSNALEKIENLPHQGEMEYLFEYHRQLTKTLKEKCDIGIRLSKAYKKRDKNELLMLVNEIKNITEEMKKTHELFSNVWLCDNKPFGLDVVDLRFGGVIARCDRAEKRVIDYVNGKIECIEELEEKKLLYNNLIVDHELPMVYECSFSRITSVQ